MCATGAMLKQGFNMLMQQHGQTVLIYKNYGTPQQVVQEVRGMKGNEERRPDKVLFEFGEALQIDRDDVLQVKGSRDFWRVTDTEDSIEGDTLISFTAHVTKEGSPVPRSVSNAPIIITNSPGANLNFGSGSIHQQASWVELTSQRIDNATTTPEEKQKAKSLLTQISENKLLNTIIGSVAGELTKAALPK